MTHTPAELRETADGAGENQFRQIPSVTELCAAMEARRITIAEPLLVELVRRELVAIRAGIRNGTPHDRATITEHVIAVASALQGPRLGGVINATGVVLHTNLGRAPVSPATAQAMAVAAASAVPLEIDAETNRRGGRMTEISALLQLLTGAESALVVNNCAAAVLLVLSALAGGREVIVSRGEAIEIGGGFRIPDVLRQSGARLVEVGTTNRTYAQDFTAATTSETAAYLKVHSSNFRISGFTHAPLASELAALARERGVPVLEDLGSGALLNTAAFGLEQEPTLRDVIASGVDLAMASGDKLLGGPQAGIIIGRAELIQSVESHPLARAVRADKVTLAGVAETLRHYVRGDAVEQLPVWRMIAAAPEELRARGELLVSKLGQQGVAAAVVGTQASVGGGSLPGETLDSLAVALHPVCGHNADSLAQRLRVGDSIAGTSGVFGRIEDERVLLDLRTVLPEDDAVLFDAVISAHGNAL